MSYQNNKKDLSQQKVIIKLRILEISPLTEDINNILSESYLIFSETNNNKYNVYNILYMLNNTIILIPTKLSDFSQINIDLIKDNDKSRSKGILYINDNSDEQVVKFNIMNKYINIKFHYSLNFMNSSDENKTKRKEIDSKNKNSKKFQKNEILNNKLGKNLINIKHKNNCNIKIIKNIKNNNELNNTERKNNFHFNVNKSQIIFPCNLIINNNKDPNENKNNYSEIWINDTKMFIKKIKKYISLRNSRNNSQKEFKKYLSSKNINSKLVNPISSLKNNIKNINTNSSSSSIDILKNNNNIFDMNEMSDMKKYRTGKKLNHSANHIKEDSFTKNKYHKYLSSTASHKKFINNDKIRKEVKSKLFKNFEEHIKVERNNENDLLNISNTKSYSERNINDINENKNINKLYTKKKIKNIFENKNNSFKINNKCNSNDNIIIKDIDNNGINKEIIKYPINNIKQSEQNNNSDIFCSFSDFYQMKNDLYLLYNKKYINNINDEFLKLEIDLFMEKITELMNEYHKNITEEKIIYKYLVNTIKNYKKLYHIYFNLNKKLNKIKEKNKEKEDEININNKDLLIFHSELSLFDMLFEKNRNEKEKNTNFEKKNFQILSKMLKNILIKILNKKYNKDMIYNVEKYKNWIIQNIEQVEESYFNETLKGRKDAKKDIKIKFKNDKKF